MEARKEYSIDDKPNQMSDYLPMLDEANGQRLDNDDNTVSSFAENNNNGRGGGGGGGSGDVVVVDDENNNNDNYQRLPYEDGNNDDEDFTDGGGYMFRKTDGERPRWRRDATTTTTTHKPAESPAIVKRDAGEAHSEKTNGTAGGGSSHEKGAHSRRKRFSFHNLRKPWKRDVDDELIRKKRFHLRKPWKRDVGLSSLRAPLKKRDVGDEVLRKKRDVYVDSMVLRRKRGSRSRSYRRYRYPYSRGRYRSRMYYGGGYPLHSPHMMHPLDYHPIY